MSIPKYLFTLVLMGVALVLTAQDSDKYLKQLQQDSFVLYFAVPIDLKAVGSRAEIVPDFTYHDYEGGIQQDKVIMNFSLITRQPVKKLDSLALYSGRQRIGIVYPEALYIEKEKKDWTTRFTVDLSPEVYLTLLRNAQDAEFRLYSESGPFVFPTDKKWRKAAGVIVEIFTLN